MTYSNPVNNNKITLRKTRDISGATDHYLTITCKGQTSRTLLACTEREAIQHFAQAVIDESNGKLANWL